MKKLGLIINPIAGMGGRVGLKGTDGQDILQKSLKLGAKPQAPRRAQEALNRLLKLKNSIAFLTCPGKMGAETAQAAGFSPELIPMELKTTTRAEDTYRAAALMRDNKVDLLLFTGGDGTARDIYSSVGDSQVVLGIPAGVKMHSAIYAVNPRQAGDLAAAYLSNESCEIREAEVMDIDEDGYRREILSAKLFGYLKIPFRKRFVQNLKVTSPAHERYYQESIAFEVAENMRDDWLYIIGPGTTTRAVMENLKLPYSLLGIDLVYKKKLAGKDMSESELLAAIQGKNAKLIITPIGGQGYILGRGNQPLSPDVINLIGKENIIIISTSNKIHALLGSPFLVDTGNYVTDKKLMGYYRIITGYHEAVIYKVSA